MIPEPAKHSLANRKQQNGYVFGRSDSFCPTEDMPWRCLFLVSFLRSRNVFELLTLEFDLLLDLGTFLQPAMPMCKTDMYNLICSLN